MGGVWFWGVVLGLGWLFFVCLCWGCLACWGEEVLEGLSYGSRCGFCFKGDGVLFFVWLWVLVLICCVGVVGWGEEVSEGWGFNYG